MAMCFSTCNNKQICLYSYMYSASLLFTLKWLFNIDLELFEKYQTTEECIRCNLEKY